MKKTTSKSQLLDSYKQRANKFSRQKQGLKKNLNVLIFLRLLTFLVMAYGTYKLGVSDLIFGLLFLILLFGVFIFIVRKHLKKKDYLRFIENLITVNRQEIEALRGNISNFKNGK